MQKLNINNPPRTAVSVPLPPSSEQYIDNESGCPLYQIGTVPIDTLLLDGQRPIGIKNINDYIKHDKGVNWDKFGIVKAAQLPNGTLRIIDGQQRMSIIKTILPSVTQVPAQIIQCTMSEAREHFKSCNSSGQKSLTAAEIWFNDLVDGQSEAIEIHDLLIDCDFSCERVNVLGLQEVKFATIKKCLGEGRDATVRAANLWHAAMDQDRMSKLTFFNSGCFHGLVKMLSIHVPPLKNEYKEINHAKELMDPNNSVYLAFNNWWMNEAARMTIGQMKYNRFKVDPNQISVAYGLTQDFVSWIGQRKLNVVRHHVQQRNFKDYLDFLQSPDKENRRNINK